MSGRISAEENDVVSRLKKDGIFLKFNPQEFAKSRNGGVAVMCSDGDIDAPTFHHYLSHRPHSARVFGGPLMFARSFPGFRESFAVSLLENIRQGMTVKDTGTLYLWFHAPCGVATAHGYNLEKQLGLIPEVRGFFLSDNFFVQEKTHILFHVKRTNKAGKEEQNTYLVPPK